MRYRIKIITYGSGRKEYIPQVKAWWWLMWKGIAFDGSAHYINFEYETRERALRNIDAHYNNNSRVHTIEFEYIKKP